MFDKETLTALQEGAAIVQAAGALAAAEDTKEIVALPNDYSLHDLEKFLPLRRRNRGSMNTVSLTHFAAYTKEHHEQGGTVFVDQVAMNATAVLNLGTSDAPGHADNLAKLQPEKTAAYKALLQHANGAGFTQKAIAEFLEDWADNCACFGSDVQPIKVSQAVAAVRKITIDAMRKVESEEQSLGATKSAFESVQASSKEPLPTLIIFKCQPYADLERRDFALRLGVLTGEATPKVNLRISKIEEHQELMAAELADRITTEMDAAIPVMLGAYTRGN
jgi:uncharacterized protein YfdQ (DUF2303 family)